MTGPVFLLLCGLVGMSSSTYNSHTLMKPLYPFQSQQSSPFAPSNDQAYINYMWWNALSGSPIESAASVVDAYDDGPDSFNTFLLKGGLDGGPVDFFTPGAYQKWTQPSNPGAGYISYNLFSNPRGLESDHPAPGSTLFEPNDDFWLLQYLQGRNRAPGAKIDNNMIRQYSYLLNSKSPANIDPYANYWAYSNSLPSKKRKRRSTEKKRKRRSASRR